MTLTNHASMAGSAHGVDSGTGEQASETAFTTWKNNILSIIPSATGSKSVAEMNIDSLSSRLPEPREV